MTPEAVLQALRDLFGGEAYRVDAQNPDAWHARCPVCAARPESLGRRPLRITAAAAGRRVTLRCDQGCSPGDVEDALGLAPKSGGGREREWPTPAGPDARHGLAGEITRTIEPHSEGDPMAILAQLLVAIGNAMGRGPGFMVEADFHSTVLYALIVGESSRGRKGTSWSRPRALLTRADPEWARDRHAEGLSSGEGLVSYVRDEVLHREPDKNSSGEWNEVVTDPGVEDKRLLVQEGEFAQALRSMQRTGNTLSPILRNLWDHGRAGAMTKTTQTRTNGAHVSVIGHIVFDELRRELAQTDTANGFANRFLFVCARRSKELPDGGDLSDEQLAPLAEALGERLAFARRVTVMKRNPEARELWHAVYGRLTESRPGLLGAVTSRSEAQVMRLAVIYALLDGSAAVRPEHLAAGLALWDYCDRSAAYIFGDSLGDPIADEILEALRAARPGGMTRGELRDHFKRDAKKTERIDSALRRLAEAGRARMEREPTGGRPAERWRAVDRIDRIDQSPITGTLPLDRTDQSPPNSNGTVDLWSIPSIPSMPAAPESSLADELVDVLLVEFPGSSWMTDEEWTAFEASHDVATYDLP